MPNTMRAIWRRLQRLEKRWGLAVESGQTEDSLVERLETLRLRQGWPPISRERVAELRGMTVMEILRSGRRCAADFAR
jgi:hypothetical protein